VFQLTLKSGAASRQAFDLPSRKEAAIGRSPDVDIPLAARGVSRRHAVIVPRGAGHVLRDAGSENGTFVNEERITERVLREGDVIRLGEAHGVTFVYAERDPRLGMTLAGYRLEERLGRGGMGTVYKATQIAMNRPVALKILAEELSRDQEFVRGFIEEARSAAKLSHPHVVAVHTVGEEEGLYYLAMEHLPGGSLKEIVRREGPIPPLRAVAMARDAARALVWAEERGIVHRDIKPANLLLDAKLRVKVADFGLARHVEPSGAAAGGEAKASGSPLYMAPEQVRRQAIDHRADIYALGGTLYTALSGKPPHSGKSVQEVIRKKLSGPPEPLSKVAPGVPPRLAAVVAKMMALDPAKRHSSAAELERELAALARELARPPTRRPARRLAGPRPRERKARRTRAVIPAAALVLLGAGLLAWWRFGAGGGSVEPSAPAVARGPGAALPGAAAGAAAGAREKNVAETKGGEGGEGKKGGRTKKGKAAAGAALATGREAPAHLLEIEDEVELLVLEGRFEEALARLRALETVRVDAAAEIARAREAVEAAAALFDARRRAALLAASGESEKAVELLEGLLDRLPAPLQEEARLAVEFLERQGRPPGG
jgi:serine/threonine-protein kinase